MRLHTRVYEDPQIPVVSTCNLLNADFLRDCKMLTLCVRSRLIPGKVWRVRKPSSRSPYAVRQLIGAPISFKDDQLRARAADLIELQSPQVSPEFVHLSTCNDAYPWKGTP